MSHIHWPGSVDSAVSYFGQELVITVDEVVGDPIGTLRIKGATFVGTGVVLPNSTHASVTWTAIPGTSPILEVRQDGYFDSDYIEIRQADGSPLGGVIEEDQVVVFNRPTLVTPGTADDMWQFRYNDNRVTYINEFACLRVRGVPDDQVPARFMSNFARDNTAHPIFQVSLSNGATHLFQVLANGDIQAPGGLSMLPTTPVGVTFNGAAGTANATTISDGSLTGTPYPVTTTLVAADNRVYLDGSVANPTGVSIPGGTVLFTVTAAHRPAFWTQRAGRTSTALQARITVKPNGDVVLDQALAPAATLSFDGVNWRKS